MTDDILDRARSIQRGVADGTTVSVKLSTLQELIAEIESLRARLADDDFREVTPASTPVMDMAKRIAKNQTGTG
jgi:hypothetical protein